MTTTTKNDASSNAMLGSMASNDGFSGITKFNGEDKTYSSAKWAADIEDNAEIFGWTAQQKLIVARRSLVGTAELWLRTEKTFKTFDELSAALQKEFPDALNSKEMHELMATRKKKKDETYYQYMLTMKELGKRAKFADYVAIQYIVDGITDYENNKAILYGVTTYSVLKEKLAIYEKMKSKTVKKTEVESKTQNVFSSSREKKETARPDGRSCYNCGDKNHLANRCPNGVKCFRCNNFGHIGTECRSSTTTRHQQQQGGSRGSGNGASGQRTMCVSVIPEDGAAAAVNGERERRGTNEVNEAEGTGSCNCQCQSQSVMRVNVNTNSAVSESLCNSNKSVKLVKISDVDVEALIDSGSDVNLMSSELLSRLNKAGHDEDNEDKVMLTGLGASRVCSVGKFHTTIKVDGKYFDTVFYIVPCGVMPYEVILGQPFLLNTTVLLDKGTVKLMAQTEGGQYMLCLPIEADEPLCSNPEVQELVASYKPMFTKEAPIKLKIILKDEVPVAQRPRRLAIKEEEVVRRQVEEWLAKEIIRPSYSEYASPLVLVTKKDGSIRVCVDYRKINQKMIKDEYPLPVIDDHIDKLSKSRVFSTLDLKNGFFHLPVEEESVKYTAFVTSSPEGQYEFLRAPFGLSICPKYFSRFINIIFREQIASGIVLIFIDDVIILAENEEEAIERLKIVLKVSSEYGLEINWKKTQLLQRKVEYLGHVIEDGTVKPSPSKTEAVRCFPEPKTVKQVHSFVGLTSYFRKYIENYAVIARPLTDLLKKEKEFYFGEEERHAFEVLKTKLCSEPVLKIYEVGLDTEMHTDASKYGYAAILMQKEKDGKLHPVHYMSRKTSETEQRNYTSYELEALAVVEGVRKFRKYLFGIHFKIVTDCAAFQKTLYKKEVSAKVARWVLFLQDFDYEVEHRAGAKMSHVDSLSRNPHCYLIHSELHARICKAQKEDSDLSVLREVLNEKTEYKDFYIENDLIYKGVEKKLVIPDIMETEIIKRAHEIGHFGKKKTMDIIDKDYYIKDLAKKIDRVILGCVPCILASKKEGKQEGFLSPIDKGELPLETLHIDHLGPLDATKKMYNYILTVVDAFTKFVWIYPTKTLTAKETVEKLRLHQKDYGNPTRYITDKGAAFTGQEFKDYCQEEGIQHHAVTTGIPRGNGQVERVHRIIISVLTKMCIEEPTHWYKHVSKVQRVINGTYQRSINTSPFNLLTGTKLKQKEDIKLIELLDEECRQHFMERRDNVRQAAKVQILKVQEENRRTYNRKRKEALDYVVGDIVAIQRTQFGNTLKLKPKFLGPYQVVKKVGKGRYHVEKVDLNTEGPRKTSTGVDYMKMWP
ncbi:uncharacterized protein K02A2.6 [Plutella xylostella]|uniref:uncharacterized protein K02A2.6 n=1 Tax=Plutella xylostella TaxID=51655 RepID=UPI002032C1BD|nr:uncharacterized protein K02A2.6 [Plutella xylostella]